MLWVWDGGPIIGHSSCLVRGFACLGDGIFLVKISLSTGRASLKSAFPRSFSSYNLQSVDHTLLFESHETQKLRYVYIYWKLKCQMLPLNNLYMYSMQYFTINMNPFILPYIPSLTTYVPPLTLDSPLVWAPVLPTSWFTGPDKGVQ